MKFVVVDELPKSKRGGGCKVRHKHTNESLREHLEKFIAMDVKFVRVDSWNSEYHTVKAVSGTFHQAVKTHSDLPVQCVMRQGEVYLVRTDM